jgi:predicted RNA-binding Zn ribbon-like protein
MYTANVSDPKTRPYVWQLIGGHVALDLANTISWRLDQAKRVDRLGSPASLVNWYAAIAGDAPRVSLEHWTAAHSDPADRATQRVRNLRGATIRVIDAHLSKDDAPPPGSDAWRADVDLLTDAWREATAAATPSPTLHLTWRIDVTTFDDVVHALALEVADLLQRPDLSRLRRCDGEGCGWVFLDTTRNHSRRWCLPQDCGNRARVRAYVERHR